MGKEANKKDVVILHQFNRATVLPSLSPFCLKLETYLRIAKIHYENDFDKPFGPGHKAPWLSYNDDSIGDSTLCVDYLSKTFDINLNANLDPRDVATGYALQIMAENHLVWCMVLHRFVHDKTKAVANLMKWTTPIPAPNSVTMYFVKNNVQKSANGHGLGRFPPETVLEFGKKDLKMLSDFLDNKLFFFGDVPTEMDCAMFGVLGQALWGLPGSPYESWMHGEFSNLKGYCYRIKDRFWPDWDECLSKP